METTTRIEIPVLLPDLPDDRDACVLRLLRDLSSRPGILDVHMAPGEAGPPLLCLHYDRNIVGLKEVERSAMAAGAALTARYGHAVLPIRAIDGEDAARRIEAGLRHLPGVLHASVSLPAQRARVEFDRGRTDETAVRRELDAMGYAPQTQPAPKRSGGGHTRGRGGLWARIIANKELSLSLGAGLLLGVAWAGQRWLELPGAAALALYAVAYALGAWDLVSHWGRALRKGNITFDIDLLMLVAAAGAAVLGEWAEGAFLLFLFSLAHALEHLALDRARGAIRALADLAPATARVLRDNQTIEVPVETVEAGEWVVVRPGERIPVDGDVRKGGSSVNQAPITGESVPVEKGEGDEVFAGTVNGDGALHVETTRAVGDRTLDRVVQLVEEAQTTKAPTERLTDRFERIFVPLVLLSAAVLAVLPAVAGWWSWDTSFYRSMALLVAASPCALAIGTPSAVLAGIAQAARNGVLIKGGVHLERLGGVAALAMDKTGTLTVGRPEVADVVAANGIEPDELLRVAAAVERNSQHPLAEAVVRRAEEKGLDLPAAGDLESLTGRGVRSRVGEETVEIGNLRLWDERGEDIPGSVRSEVDRLVEAGRSVMIVRHGDRWLGTIGVVDQPRPGVAEVLNAIRAQGIDTLVMMTGDNRGVAEAVAREVGIDEVMADLLPEDKVEGVKGLLTRYNGVAMVGDGVNDAPALATADVGIAMGGAGTAAALETADVALMGDELAGIPFVIGLSRRTRAIILQNLGISLGVIALLIVATTTGAFGIGPAVLVHEGSTLLVVGNALRLLRYRPPTTST
ncbi:heavy metal translocating P-type ATPase [Gaopeijia maritima]|uniref:Heavy metal translocating P-type ATPase n=1 Tax=Gaopeijia maritima TaxID=3119007 RepID=A0ABU9E5Z6_9BACT